MKKVLMIWKVIYRKLLRRRQWIGFEEKKCWYKYKMLAVAYNTRCARFSIWKKKWFGHWIRVNRLVTEMMELVFMWKLSQFLWTITSIYVLSVSRETNWKWFMSQMLISNTQLLQKERESIQVGCVCVCATICKRAKTHFQLTFNAHTCMHPSHL